MKEIKKKPEITKPTKQERLDAMHRREKIKKEIITVSIILLVLVGFYFLISNSSKTQQKYIPPKVNSSKVPENPIHWHPQLQILFDGVPQTINSNIGIGGGIHSQTHTHESGGVIHMENQNPKKSPEKMTLSYFFYTWKKTFNSTCILDKCTNIDGGTLKFSVDGIENFEYENFIMGEKSKLLIEYNSN